MVRRIEPEARRHSSIARQRLLAAGRKGQLRGATKLKVVLVLTDDANRTSDGQISQRGGIRLLKRDGADRRLVAALPQGDRRPQVQLKTIPETQRRVHVRDQPVVHDTAG